MWKSQKYLQEIQKSAIEVDDYTCLNSYVRDKRIVLLGESSHGVGDYYTEKIKMIQYLHEHHGFNVVVFENGLIESITSRERLLLEEPKLVLQQHFMDIYHNEEMLALLKESWAQNLILTGMDPQPMYREASTYYIKTIKNGLDEVTYELLQIAENQYFELDDQFLSTKLKHLKSKILTCINSYKELLDKAHLINELQQPLLFHKFLQNRIDWLTVNLKGLLSSGAARAKYMYKNVEWLLKFYRGEKLIIWAHNFHICKSKTWFNKLLRIQNVGYSLQKSRPEQSFTIGLYASSGHVASLYRNELEIKFHYKHHLENICNQSSEKSLFLPLNASKYGAKKWLLFESGMRGNLPKRIKPKAHYDAIICLKNVRLPKYLPRKNTLNDESGNLEIKND